MTNLAVEAYMPRWADEKGCAVVFWDLEVEEGNSQEREEQVFGT